MTSWPVLKEGTPIRCCMCGAIILVAATDIAWGSPLSSKYLKHPDGKPLEHGARKVCPECWIKYRSISTETAETIL